MMSILLQQIERRFYPKISIILK